MKTEELRYLQRLAELYPTIGKASTEIINLQSILNLPKGTEHFLSDIHGEYEAFSHVLRNGSGAVRKKIDDVFGHTLSNSDKRSLATLVYYPKEKIAYVKKKESDMQNWYKITLYRLIEVCKTTASKYTRSKVRKALPSDYAYVIEELITEKAEVLDKEAYYDSIVDTIIDIGRAENFIIALAELIQRLVVDHLHVLGDIYDRGPGPHFIMDRLMDYHSLDIQWGNHDVVWMGAAVGQAACMATVIRNSIRYGNLDILEDGYGINMMPLAAFAMEVYGDDPCQVFEVHGNPSNYNALEKELSRKMHKAISIIQFKLEGVLAKEHPDFHMENRCVLEGIDPEKGTVQLPDGSVHNLLDTHFPTIDWEHPYELSVDEADVMERLTAAFLNCEKLQRQVRFLFTKGSLYHVYNGNLLYHGCVPLNEDGSFTKVNIYGTEYAGKALYDVLESYARKGYYAIDPEEKKKGSDILWFIWENKNSPVFGKDKMTTFERYFVAEKATHVEPKNPYYRLLEKEEVVNAILAEFGLSGQEAHIVNGHIPIEAKKGESPVKCGGKLLIIDGGFSKAYQPKTGIAGYTLIYNSYGLVLAAHEPFESVEKAVSDGNDIVSHTILVQHVVRRKTVADTDNGKVMRENIRDLENLLQAYREGTIVENP